MESEGSLPCLQDPATGPYPELDESNPHPQTYFPKISFNILPCHLRLSSGLFHSDLPTKIVYAFLMCTTCPAHLTPLDLIIQTILGEEYKLWSSWICSFLQPPDTLSLLGSNILLSNLFSDTFSLCSSLNARDQVPRPYRTTGKIIVSCILIFTFCDSRQKILNCMMGSISRI
jgi:hypothetical protein